MISFTTVVLPCPFSPISAMRSPGRSTMLKFFSTRRVVPGYANETLRNSNPRSIGSGTCQPFGFAIDRRLHLEERQQVRQKQRLIRNARSRRKHLLQIRAGLLNRRRQKVN